jgi:thioredoxin 1
VEDGKGRQPGRRFRVKRWPTVVFLRDGEEAARVVRPSTTEEVAEALATVLPPRADGADTRKK